MTDEEALLQAVIADPDDDAPRLIYADWLDEHGQGERAEFIRVQIALAGMPLNDERRPELRRIERRLLRRFGERWAHSLRVPWCHAYSRGFVECVSCSADQFLSGGEALFTLAPIRQLHLTNAHQRAPLMGSCAFLWRSLGLSLRRNWLDDRDVCALANSRVLGRLTSLDLANNRISALGARYLAGSPYLGSLDDLYLKGNPIPREARTELRRRFGSRVHF